MKDCVADDLTVDQLDEKLFVLSFLKQRCQRKLQKDTFGFFFAGDRCEHYVVLFFSNCCGTWCLGEVLPCLS